MKTTWSFFVFVAMLAVVSSYSTHTDDLDIESLLEKDEHHRQLMHCVLQKVTCMEVTQAERDHLQDAIKTRCGGCSELQKTRLKQLIFKTKYTLPEEYAMFKQQFDPENKYLDQFEESISQF